ncbi:MAG: RNA 2',3'-cyclic phosphodiesterase [Pirellulales bacterium]|nr:RNA 2',3'-cyclic phosphodiesterase [Pirellulales bacterium]
MPILRTFIAVEIGPDVAGRAQTLINRLKATDAKVSWIRPQQMHFTLNFLGDIRDREIPELLRLVTDAVRPLPAFDLLCRGLGVFPSLENPRTIWLGVTTGAEAMIELHQALDRGLKQLGLRGEGRRFRPHLTLGRVRSLPHGPENLAELIAEYAAYEAGVMSVCDVTIMHSDPHGNGSSYEPLGQAELLG